MSTHVAASSQLFYSLATLVIKKDRPRLAEDKLDEIEGIRAEVMRYGTKRTKYKNKLVWGFSCTVRTWKLTFKKKRPPDRYEENKNRHVGSYDKNQTTLGTGEDDSELCRQAAAGNQTPLLIQKNPNCRSKKGCWRLYHRAQSKHRKLGRRKDQMARCLAEKRSSDARPPQSDLRCS